MSNCSWETSGPISVAGSKPLPTWIASAAADTPATRPSRSARDCCSSRSGPGAATLTTAGGDRRLSGRHGEIVTLLAHHPAGLSSRELAELVYGEPGHEVSVRAELHRLRDILGHTLATRFYRLQDIEIERAATPE